MDDQQYGQSPYDQSGGYSQGGYGQGHEQGGYSPATGEQGGYGQGTGEQGQATAYSQAQQGQHDQHAEEDVEIDWQHTQEDSLQISMDDLRSAGYEPPADDDSANSPSYIA